MSAYNILNSEVKCSNCHKVYSGRIQFKFGDTWQIEYNINDKIKWGGNEIGTPGISEVKVYGILETDVCPLCGMENNENEYDVIIKKDFITGVTSIADMKDYFSEEENYKVCIE